MFGGQYAKVLFMPGSTADKATRMSHIVNAVSAAKAALLADPDETDICHDESGFKTRRRDEYAKGVAVVEIEAYETTYNFLRDVEFLAALLPGVVWHVDDENESLLFCTAPARLVAMLHGEAA